MSSVMRVRSDVMGTTPCEMDCAASSYSCFRKETEVKRASESGRREPANLRNCYQRTHAPGLPRSGLVQYTLCLLGDLEVPPPEKTARGKALFSRAIGHEPRIAACAPR